MVFLTNLLNYKRHITESDNGYVPYCFLQCCFFTAPYRFTLFSNPHSKRLIICSVLLPYRFTLFSNFTVIALLKLVVLLPYRFTLFSNIMLTNSTRITVLLPYRFTLFSNTMSSNKYPWEFYYLIDLHYSQTQIGNKMHPLYCARQIYKDIL